MTRASSISRKLTWMNMSVSATALLLACFAFLAYDQYTFRESLLRTLSAQAQIVGTSSVSAITFNDPQSAEVTLSALRSSPDILSAGIYTPDGRRFAEYSRDRKEQVLMVPVIPRGELETHVFRGDEVVLVRTIMFQGKPTGTVYIRSDLREMDYRLRRYVLIAAAVLLISLVVALLISSAFRRSVARPIIDLAETARAVSRDKNYALRAHPTADRTEVAVLIQAFNEMLSQIQQQNEELNAAHVELEERVLQRTRQLQAANKELEAFSYTVSHDLRSPLEIVSGFSHILALEYADKLDENGRDYLQQIRTSTQRMSELIEDLLNLSRVSSTAMHRESLDLSVIARTIADDLRRQDPARQVEFIIPECSMAEGDSRLLRVVLDNLMRNAWKYSSSHATARIEFGCKQDGPRTIYFVRDDGAGFDPRYADRLFKPFQRLHSAADFPGTGIGLATVQRIIHRHGGEIWADGSPNKGATFYFTLHWQDSTVGEDQQIA